MGKTVVGSRLLPTPFVFSELLLCSRLRTALKMGDPRIGCVKYEGASSIHLNLQQKEMTDAPGLKIAILRSWDTCWFMSLRFSGP